MTNSLMKCPKNGDFDIYDTNDIYNIHRLI